MTLTAQHEICGPYELIAEPPRSNFKVTNGGVLELQAEQTYVVKRLSEDAPRDVLKGALEIPAAGNEGRLNFGNFIGQAELGGRRLQVHSNRLRAIAVDAMLDEVCAELAALPFFADTPTGATYARERALGPSPLYHAFALLRDAWRESGPRSLREAVERILATPHERLELDEPLLAPLGAVDRIDADTLEAIVSEPELLGRVDPGSPLASHPLAQRLGGRMPDWIRTQPYAQSTDNAENRFVVGAIEGMIDVLRRFERQVREEKRPAAAANGREAAEISAYLRRSLRHRVLEKVPAVRDLPQQSTVLRARPGYRELLRLHTELLGRSRFGEPSDVQRLLELRDAATIYEFWCYFQVVASVTAVLGEEPQLSRFKVDQLASKMPNGFRADWNGTALFYNVTFSKASAAPNLQGFDSYSLQLRPDITLRSDVSGVHLLDAKLKRQRFQSAVDSQDDEKANNPVDAFKREDLYKMHAYRDALGANSVWVLYPGHDETPAKYGAPGSAATDGFQGVGAVALRPGAAGDGGLESLLKALLRPSQPPHINA